jgi:CRISPR-associated endonuclease/helicase Cas3
MPLARQYGWPLSPPALPCVCVRLLALYRSGDENQRTPAQLRQFRLGMIPACSGAADRISSADFACPVTLRRSGPADWQTAIERLEAKTFPAGNDSVNAISRAVAEQCRKRAEDPQGIYTLTVPTGGGKTFASMRYALHHAKAHQLDRIIYIRPLA